jgi:hypothetical protein
VSLQACGAVGARSATDILLIGSSIWTEGLVVSRLGSSVAWTCFLGPRLFQAHRYNPRTYKTGPRYGLTNHHLPLLIKGPRTA